MLYALTRSVAGRDSAVPGKTGQTAVQREKGQRGMTTGDGRFDDWWPW